MTNRHWRELLEIIGVISIVAAILLLAAQVRESNAIAAAQTEIQVNEAFDLLQGLRASNPDFAKLFPKLEAPEAHLTTATEASQIRGMAWHIMNGLWSVHTAYENGLLSRSARDGLVADFAYSIQKWPGIRSHYIAIYENLGPRQGVDVYAPIAEYIAAQNGVETTPK